MPRRPSASCPRAASSFRAALGASLVVALAACGGGGSGGGSATPTDPGGGGGDGDGGGGGGAGLALPSAPVLLLATVERDATPVDDDFATWAFRAPHTVVRAQVVRTDTGGAPVVLDATQVEVTYDAEPSPDGSVNSRSVGKTGFWDADLARLFGVQPARGAGLRGLTMPGDASPAAPQRVPWSASEGCFLADGVPLLPVDDAGLPAETPRLRLRARDVASGATLAETVVVAPVRHERGCVACHATGSVGARRAGLAWSADPDPARAARENVAVLHDAQRGRSADPVPRPVPCALCHYTSVRDVTGWGTLPSPGLPSLSTAVHGAHAALTDDAGAPLIPADATGCVRCHDAPHASRGAMVAAGMTCVDCHGSMTAVAGTAPLRTGGSVDGTRDGAARLAWHDEPRCESCHTGDAVQRANGADLVVAADGLRLRRAFRTGDPAASPLRSDGARFAAPAGTPFRQAKGHGGLLCSTCHGGAHASFGPSGAGFDDEAPLRLQGHVGAVLECRACHADGTLPPTTGGPHGLHPVADAAWTVGGHGASYAADPDQCRACHGVDGEGTVLSRAAADRTFALPGRTVTLARGTMVSCGSCHAAHPTDTAWVASGHGPAFAADGATCRSCHGADLSGTALASVAADRAYVVGGRTYRLAAGTQVACDACHVTHATDLAWVDGGHGAAYAADTTACASCHGADGAGSALTTAAADRSYLVGGTTYRLAAGSVVGCDDCHTTHATTSTWVSTTHGPLYESDPQGCRVCHGASLGGTLLSKTASTRTYTFGKVTKTFSSGTQVACATCHTMHAVSDTFFANHDDTYEKDKTACRLCHGHTLSGTSLSVAAADRTLRKDGKNWTIKAGTKVHCGLCHSKP